MRRVSVLGPCADGASLGLTSDDRHARDGYGERDAALVMIEGGGGGTDHRRWRQGIRHARLRRGLRAMVSPACGPLRVHLASGSAATADDAASRLCDQSAETKAGEQGFGWMKPSASPQLRHRGGALVTWVFTFTAAAYNIVRLRRRGTPRVRGAQR